jgi:hypothetical protein
MPLLVAGTECCLINGHDSDDKVPLWGKGQVDTGMGYCLKGSYMPFILLSL